MEELLGTWAQRLIAAVLLLTVVYLLTPPGRLRAAVRFTGGLVLLTALLGPLAGLGQVGAMSYEDCAEDVDRRIEELQAAYAEKTRALIEERTAAYISDKGRAMGVECRPVVTAEIRGGVACPWSVAMDCPYHASLSACIAAELDIPEQRQSWQGG